MFRSFPSLFLLGLTLSVATAVAQDGRIDQVRLHVLLSPASETPPNTDVNAGGSATVLLQVTHTPSEGGCAGAACTDDEGFADPAAIGEISAATVDFMVSLNADAPQTVTAMHIHRGSAGAAGSVVLNSELGQAFDVQGSTTFSRSVSVTDPMTLDVLEEILANPQGFYLNVHAQSNPQGLVRGQLRSPRNSAAKPSHVDITLTLREIVATLQQIRIENAAERDTLARVARRLGVVATDPGTVDPGDLDEVSVPECNDQDDDGIDDDTGEACEESEDEDDDS